MAFTAKELYEIAGLNSDGIAGFQAQVADRFKKLEVLWPGHLTGSRLSSYREGSELARAWLAMRRGYAAARRRQRAKDFREQGVTSCLRPTGAALHAERIACLREVVRFHTAAKAG